MSFVYLKLSEDFQVLYILDRIMGGCHIQSIYVQQINYTDFPDFYKIRQRVITWNQRNIIQSITTVWVVLTSVYLLFRLPYRRGSAVMVAYDVRREVSGAQERLRTSRSICDRNFARFDGRSYYRISSLSDGHSVSLTCVCSKQIVQAHGGYRSLRLATLLSGLF